MYQCALIETKTGSRSHVDSEQTTKTKERYPKSQQTKWRSLQQAPDGEDVAGNPSSSSLVMSGGLTLGERLAVLDEGPRAGLVGDN